MKVLGIDPGYGRVGWALLEGDTSSQKLIAADCFETSATKELPLRLVDIHEHISQLIETYEPDEAAIEDLFYFKNKKTVIGVGQARGVIVVALVQKKVPVFDYTPLQVKSSVAGHGQAEKKQVQMMVKALLGSSAPKQDDAADAAAVALTHLFTNPVFR